MKLNLRQELTTEPTYAARLEEGRIAPNPGAGTIVMFTRTIEYQLTAHEIVDCAGDKPLRIKIDDEWCTIQSPRAIDDSAIDACSISHVAKSLDSFRHYGSLIEKGWIPEIGNVKAVQSRGYVEFNLTNLT